ncbi:MAG: tetratricopeptide repeat protein [Coriobacteriia bacterium]|nr:tetratricopeptide repeat protein [Coriobacteriia bacterium]
MSGHGAHLEHDLSPQQFARFRDYIHEHSGIHLEKGRMDPLRISLVARATRFGLDSLEQYYTILAADEGEFRELMNLVTINETSFFRFPGQFKALRTFVIPEILDARSSAMRSFRVWSAGCSTGEEPYSIAMTLLDAGIDSLGHHAEVLGTDVSTDALERAKSGVYSPRALLNVPHEVVKRYFEPTATGHRVVDQVRRVVEFRYQNLIKEPCPTALMGNWDVIFCRNVTIYFRIESTRRVVESLFESLNPGGYLFIGHSESLTGITERFETIEVGGVFLYRKPVSVAVSASFPEAVEQQRRLGRDARTRRAESASAKFEIRTSVAPRASAAATPESAGGTLLLEAARAAAIAGRPHEVLQATRDLLAAEPGNAEAHLLAARAYADNGDFEDALASAEEALRIDPLLATARYILGLIHLRSGRPEAAIAEFRRTIYADDTFVLAHLNLGNLHRGRGEYAEACREYEAALRALERAPEGSWSGFLGGFEPDVLAVTCERSLLECRRMCEHG